jgi:hypothetical protein
LRGFIHGAPLASDTIQLSEIKNKVNPPYFWLHYENQASTLWKKILEEAFRFIENTRDMLIKRAT